MKLSIQSIESSHTLTKGEARAIYQGCIAPRSDIRSSSMGEEFQWSAWPERQGDFELLEKLLLEEFSELDWEGTTQQGRTISLKNLYRPSWGFDSGWMNQEFPEGHYLVVDLQGSAEFAEVVWDSLAKFLGEDGPVELRIRGAWVLEGPGFEAREAFDVLVEVDQEHRYQLYEIIQGGKSFVSRTEALIRAGERRDRSESGWNAREARAQNIEPDPEEVEEFLKAFEDPKG